MNNLVTQLVVSFVVGGAFIALLTFVAERVNARIAGIILSFPSTIALGYFFLGWALSPEVIVGVVPTTLVALGMIVPFAATYVITAKAIDRVTKNKSIQIAVSFSTSIIMWLVVTLLFVDRIHNLFVGVVGYLILVIIGAKLIPKCEVNRNLVVRYTTSQKLGRAIFIGCVIVLVVLLGKTAGAVWGGAFSVFPAALLSSLVVLHWHHNPEKLCGMVQKVATGSISLLTYAITAMVVFPAVGFMAGTVISYGVSLFVALILIKFAK